MSDEEDSQEHASSSAKRRKINEEGDEPSNSSLSSPSTQENPFSLYLTKVSGIAPKFNTRSLALDMKDILSLDSSSFVSSAQFNYMIDLDWLESQYPLPSRQKPLLLICGDRGTDISLLRSQLSSRSHASLARARLELPFGTHHTKMTLLEYSDGVRVVVHTANRIEQDWLQKTQALFLSEKFLFGSNQKESGFKTDLLEYLKAYGAPPLNKWIDLISRSDMSTARVRLIGSVPGRHTGAEMHRWGHLKLRKLLSASPARDSTWSIIGQFSSIGSLGPTPDKWLLGEFLQTLSSTKDNPDRKTPKMKLIYPTVEDVRTSLEGYEAGASLPYGKETAGKQPYLERFMQWKADRTGRTHASPHVKTYLRTDSTFGKIAWILLTSANLSKAAWGVFEKNNTQCMIRSYELGVLFIPGEFDKECFTLGEDGILVPFDLPPTPYAAADKPWCVDARYRTPDVHGQVWG